jgi:hypothetical protein
VCGRLRLSRSFYKRLISTSEIYLKPFWMADWFYFVTVALDEASAVCQRLSLCQTFWRRADADFGIGVRRC